MKSYRRTLVLTLATSALVLFCTGKAWANLIVSYDTNGLAGNEASVVGNAPDAGITAAALLRGVGTGVTSGADSFNSNSWNGTAATPGSDTEYMSFGFTVDANTSVDLTDLTITTRSSNTGPGTLGLYSSLDSFVNPVFTFNQSDDTFLDSTVNLSSLATLSATSIEFRIIEIGNTQADGSGTTSSGGTFRVVNFQQNASQPISFNGIITATIPEPSAALGAFLLVAATALFRRRRVRFGVT